MKTRLTVKNKINADLSTVWNKWTGANHMVNWNFANDDWHCPKAENNLTEGGRLKATMAAKDGSFAFDFEAVYDEIIPLSKISYTMGDGRKVDVNFAEENNQTILVESFDPESENSLEMQQSGWQAILDNFKKYCEQ